MVQQFLQLINLNTAQLYYFLKLDILVLLNYTILFLPIMSTLALLLL